MLKRKAGSNSLKETEKRRKQVFKPVLDNPLTQSNVWPFVPPEDGGAIVDLLEHILAPIGRYNAAKKHLSRSGTVTEKSIDLRPPQIKEKITVGFNSTVGALEKQAQLGRNCRLKAANRQRGDNGSSKKGDDPPEDYIQYVFVAKFDIALALLTNPFPVLSYTASWSEDTRVKLIQIPKGSRERLSGALKMEDVTIIGLQAGVESASHLYKMANKIKNVDVPWLEGYFDGRVSSHFASPASRVVSTTAPIMEKKNQQKEKKKSTEKGVKVEGRREGGSK